MHCLLGSERSRLHFEIELDFDLRATSACLSQTQHKVEGGGTCSRVGDLGRLASSCRRSTCSKARSKATCFSYSSENHSARFVSASYTIPSI